MNDLIWSLDASSATKVSGYLKREKRSNLSKCKEWNWYWQHTFALVSFLSLSALSLILSQIWLCIKQHTSYRIHKRGLFRSLSTLGDNKENICRRKENMHLKTSDEHYFHSFALFCTMQRTLCHIFCLAFSENPTTIIKEEKLSSSEDEEEEIPDSGSTVITVVQHEDDDEPDDSQQTSDGKLVCSICSYATKSRRKYKNHEFAEHGLGEESENARINCRHCDYSTASEKKLKRHSLKCHPLTTSSSSGSSSISLIENEESRWKNEFFFAQLKSKV